MSHHLSAEAIARWASMPIETDAPGLTFRFLEALAEACSRGVPPDPLPMAEAVRAGSRHLTTVIRRTERRLSNMWYSDEWLQMCTRRSELEWVLELWGQGDDELAQEIRYRVDTEEFDDGLRQRAVYEGGLRADQIPPGTPRSHWWWWLKLGDPTAATKPG